MVKFLKNSQKRSNYPINFCNFTKKSYFDLFLQSSTPEISISSSDGEESYSTSSFETIEHRIVIAKKRKIDPDPKEEPEVKEQKVKEDIFYLDIQEAEILAQNQIFQPQLKIEDIYNHPDIYVDLPVKPEHNDHLTSSRSSSSDLQDDSRPVEKPISKSEFVSKVRRKSTETSSLRNSPPDLVDLEAKLNKSKSVTEDIEEIPFEIKKERIEAIFREPMTEPEVITLDD